MNQHVHVRATHLVGVLCPTCHENIPCEVPLPEKVVSPEFWEGVHAAVLAGHRCDEWTVEVINKGVKDA